MINALLEFEDQANLQLIDFQLKGHTLANILSWF